MQAIKCMSNSEIDPSLPYNMTKGVVVGDGAVGKACRKLCNHRSSNAYRPLPDLPPHILYH